MKRKYPLGLTLLQTNSLKRCSAYPPTTNGNTRKNGAPEYRCAACGREVHYPDTLDRDGRCEDCHTAS